MSKSKSEASTVACCVFLFASVTGVATAQEARLSIERLYSLPSLIGTAPRGFAWSPDGRHLAFLWNDEGFNFRDVWLLDIEEPDLRPERVTWMPRRERDPGVTGVIFHPDGLRMMVSFAGDLWNVTPGTGPRNLTQSEAVESRVAYSPDGGRVAFLREGELWLMSEGSPPRQRTRIAADDVEVAGFRWSPDGSRIVILEADSRGVPQRLIPDYLTDEPVLHRVRRAYPGDEPVKQRLGILPAGEGPIDWIELAEAAPDMLLSYRWSPDGRNLAVDTSDLYAKNRRIFVVDAATGMPRVVARDVDPSNETFYFWRIEWSTDGELLYFLSDRRHDYHVWAVEPATSNEPRQLTSGSWAVSEMHPVHGGLVVVGNRDRAEQRQLFRVSDHGGRAERLSHRAGTHTPTLSPDGTYAAVAFSSDDTPPELLLTEVDPARSRLAETGHGSQLRQTERRITESPLGEFHSYRWVTPEYVTFPSHVDETVLNGRLTLPPDFDPDESYPAILGSVYTDSVRNQWGGRRAHPTWGLDQFLAQQGYVLLNVDMRGSWGRGREHRRGIRLDYGGMDIEDLESGVRYLGALGYVDMERVGIWGSSYGGLMTAMSLFRKPGLYAAGIAAAPATNVWHALTGQMAVMMRPEDQPEEYADSSAFLHAPGLADPLMILHGMRDRVVLYKDSVTLLQRLIVLGKEDVELVTLPDAGHGWDNESLTQTRFAYRKMVDFFDRHLRAGHLESFRQ